MYGNFYPQKSAYRKFHSTKTSLVHLLDNIYHTTDNDLATPLLYLDLTAAFDTIDHKMLFNLLNSNLGISVSVHSWLSADLADMSFRVRIDSFTSSSLPTMCAVPQSSVLGPILFSLYTAPIYRQSCRQFWR